MRMPMSAGFVIHSHRINHTDQHRCFSFCTKEYCFKSSKSNLQEPSINIPDKPTEKEMPSKVLRFIFGKYIVYLTRFQSSLANEMPDLARMLRVFKSGIKEFIVDLR